MLGPKVAKQSNVILGVYIPIMPFGAMQVCISVHAVWVSRGIQNSKAVIDVDFSNIQS